jgi:hypothetical protein
MCRTCGCGDIDEYDDDLEDMLEDDPAWAFGTQFLRDLGDDGSELDRDRSSDGMMHVQDNNYVNDVYDDEFNALLEEQERDREYREQNPEEQDDENWSTEADEQSPEDDYP